MKIVFRGVLCGAGCAKSGLCHFLLPALRLLALLPLIFKELFLIMAYHFLIVISYSRKSSSCNLELVTGLFLKLGVLKLLQL